MFGIGKGMVEGMGKVMDWGIKKVIKKQVLFFFLTFLGNGWGNGSMNV